ncbi:MAG: DNA polymerase III subunit delta' [Elusimicrobia bacterium RIFOXYB2_FULL_48_7]|nr:MAG: DNA polymerase III subunit delta' [Elusimicrobia bacterium RIFOXYB2_FULL_48_7]
MSFKDILGQDRAINLLQKQLSNNKVPHAYLFSGAEGTGRKKTALELAKALNCRNQDGCACDTCVSCKKTEGGNHPDVHLVDFNFQAALLDEDAEKQTRIKIETIKEAQKQISMKASEGRWKVFIIDPAEKMNAESANCLLKTLEEPPANSLMILVSSSNSSMPQTLLSRCQQIRFNRLPDGIISKIIWKAAPEKTGSLNDVIKFAGGSVSRALQYAENPGDIRELLELWEGLKNNRAGTLDLLSFSDTLARDKQQLEEFISKILVLAQSELSETPDLPEKAELIEFILKCKKSMRYNVNSGLLSDILLMKLSSLGEGINASSR